MHDLRRCCRQKTHENATNIASDPPAQLNHPNHPRSDTPTRRSRALLLLGHQADFFLRGPALSEEDAFFFPVLEFACLALACFAFAPDFTLVCDVAFFAGLAAGFAGRPVEGGWKPVRAMASAGAS